MAKSELCKLAIKLGDELRELGYLTNSEEVIDLYREKIKIVSELLDGNISIIQEAVRTYFLLKHVKVGLDERTFSIEFSNKNSGAQVGLVCCVNSNNEKIRYYIKTHQHGPVTNELRSTEPPDGKELFVYKLLEHIGIGPEVHFIVPFHGSKRTVYIATRDAEMSLMSNLQIPPCTGDVSVNIQTSVPYLNAAKLVHSGSFGNVVNVSSLLQIDLLSRILYLTDCSTNSSNCGQVGYTGAPMIIDFRINTRLLYFQNDIVTRFLSGNNGYNYDTSNAICDGKRFGVR